MQEQFAQKMIEILNLFTETQSENMKTVADIIVDRIKEGGRFFVFGTGHSHMVGEEFYARAGGLACVQLIAPMELTLGEHPLKSTQIERIAEYAHVNESTLFRKFGSKKEIVLSAMQENWHPHLSSDDFYPITGDLYRDLLHFSSVYMQKVTPQFVKVSIGLRSPELYQDTVEGIMKVPQVFKDILMQYFEEMQKLDKVIQQDIESLAISFLSINFGFVFFKASFGSGLTEMKADEYIIKMVDAFVHGVAK